MKRERRFFRNVPAATARRAEGSKDGPRVIAGYAARFYDPADPGTQIELYDGLFERIMPGAFNRAIAEGHDVRCLFNHDPDNVLGRTAAGSCRLSVDAQGLLYECDENQADPAAAAVCAKLERGDVSGSSFAFVPTRVVWIDDAENDLSIREIHDVDLFDVGPVTFPWYDAATAGIRSGTDAEQAEALAEVEKWAIEAAARRRKEKHGGGGPTLEQLRARVEVDYRLALLRASRLR